MVPGSSSLQKKVDPSHYTKKYYLTDCSGYDLFKKTKGSSLDDRLAFIANQLPVRPNLRVLDLGCGRGELAIWLAKKRCIVTGVDYSNAAIDLANQARSKLKSVEKSRLTFQVGDIDRLPFPKNSFDAVVCTEVLEHIYTWEQEKMLEQLAFILTPSGFIFFHTSPSRWFNDYTYRYWCYPVSTILIRFWNLLFSKKYGNILPPNQLRTHYHKLMHINEPDYFSLRALFSRHGYSGSIKSSNVTVAKPFISWKDKLYNFLVYLIPVSNFAPFNIFFGADYYGLMRKS